MFEHLIRELRRLEGAHRVPVSAPTDAEGFLDCECPAAQCETQFKVHEDDWRDKVRDEEVFCAFCGHTAPSDQWWTQEQLARARKQAIARIERRIGEAMSRDARAWNSRQPRRGLVRITMKAGNRPSHVFVPSAAAEPLRMKITCPACSCRYAVIGSAFFCPACGHNAIDLMFTQSLAGIRAAIGAISSVRSMVEDRDAAETTARLITESGLQNAVTTFQRYAESLYSDLPSQTQPRRNAFQNLAEGSGLWRDATGKGYDAFLDHQEMAALRRFFQMRHLIAHTQGIVDADYIEKSGDTTYRIGQRVVIRENAVTECVSLIETLAAGMAADAVFAPTRS